VIDPPVKQECPKKTPTTKRRPSTVLSQVESHLEENFRFQESKLRYSDTRPKSAGFLLPTASSNRRSQMGKGIRQKLATKSQDWHDLENYDVLFSMFLLTLSQN
jgi:hypothetical protein